MPLKIAARSSKRFKGGTFMSNENAELAVKQITQLLKLNLNEVISEDIEKTDEALDHNYIYSLLVDNKIDQAIKILHQLVITNWRNNREIDFDSIIWICDILTYLKKQELLSEHIMEIICDMAIPLKNLN
jgi:hypothetical protein